MFNVGTGELMVILLVALLVLGPTKLPGAARQTAKTLTELRKVSTGFQREMRAAMDDAIEVDARRQGAQVVAESREPDATTEIAAPPAADDANGDGAGTASGSADDTADALDTGSGTDDPSVSTAEAAGMYSASMTREPADAADAGDDEPASRS